MAFATLDGVPMLVIGVPQRHFYPSAVAMGSTAIDAANEAVIMVGQVYTSDGGSHTIDTSGSSSLGWRCGTATFSNAGTTVKVGLAPVDTANGPSARAANTANVIDFDVFASFTGGGGGITGNAWQESVPTSGSKTVANGDLVAFAIQMTARGGTDAVNPNGINGPLTTAGLPTWSTYTGGSYATPGRLPNAVITFSDGARGYFYGGYVASGISSTTWNNTSGTKEYGNLIQLPFPAKAFGIVCSAAISGDTDAILYSDPLGTPSAQKTVSIDLNTVGDSTASVHSVLFASPYSMAANTPYAAILKPTSATNISLSYKTFGATAHQNSESGGNGYAISRNAGAFASQNSGLDRYSIGLLVGAFDDATGGGGTTIVGVIGS